MPDHDRKAAYEPPPKDEERWMRAARGGDVAQFAPVYEHYVDRIYAYCRYRVGAADAEDVTSQVFINALAGLNAYRGGSVAAWLFRIAHNCVVDHLRARRPQVSLDDSMLSLTDPGTSVIEQVARAEDVALVRRLIAELPDEHINLLALKLAGGLSAKEISAAVGKSHAAVRVELHRIIQRLRARFQEHVEVEP